MNTLSIQSPPPCCKIDKETKNLAEKCAINDIKFAEQLQRPINMKKI